MNFCIIYRLTELNHGGIKVEKGFLKNRIKMKDVFEGEFSGYIWIIIFPLVLSLCLFIETYDVISNEMNAFAESTIIQMDTQINDVVTYIKATSDVITSSQIFHEVSSGERTDYDTLRELSASMASTKRSFPYIENIYYISESQQIICSDKGWYGYSSLPAILSRVSTTENVLLSRISDNSEDWSILNSDGVTPYYCARVTDINGNTTDILMITIRMSTFLDIFSRTGAALCCIYKDDFSISSNLLSPYNYDIDWRDTAAVRQLTGVNVKCIYFSGEKYDYLIALDRREYYSPLYIIGGLFLFYAVAVVLLEANHLIRLARKRHDRLMSLVEALPQSQPKDPTYDGIYQAIRANLINSGAAQEAVPQTSFERQLHSMLYGHYSGSKRELLRNNGIPTDSGKYYIIMFRILHVPSSIENTDEAESLQFMTEYVLYSAMNALLPEKLSLASCVNADGIAALVSSSDADSLRGLTEDYIKSTVNFIRETYKTMIQAFVSAPFSDVERAPEAFQELNALSRFVQAVDTISPAVWQEDIQSGGETLLRGDFSQNLQILANTIQFGKFNLLPSMVSDIATNYILSLSEQYAAASSRLAALTNTIAETILSAELPGVDTGAICQQFYTVKTVHELLSLTERISAEITSTAEKTPNANPILRRAVTYIENNLSDSGMSTTLICDELEINSQRLNRMFQSAYNMSVVDFLNKLRVEKAKRLLSDTGLTIAEIAESVGYTTPATLTRNFRKLEGLTPTEYRQL